MHRFTSHRDHTRRYFAHLGVPLAPWCNLLGHRPVTRVQESKFSDPWLLTECRWCGRRAREDDSAVRSVTDGMTPDERRAELKRIQAARVENARRNPVQFAASVYDRRTSFVNDRKLELSLEVVDRRHLIAKRGLAKVLLDNLGFSVRIGNRWSESPYHLHVDAGVFGAYASAGGMFGRLAHWIGRGYKREVSLQVHGGHLWWKVWHGTEGGDYGSDDGHRCDSWRQPTVWPWSRGRKKSRQWMCLRDGNIDLNPADALWGRPRPERVTLEGDVTLGVPMGEFVGDSYLITGKLERWDWAREHGPAWARKADTTYEFDWRCDPGIPVSTDRDWKGNEVLGSGVRLTHAEVFTGDWKALVVERVIAQMQRDRRRYGYTPPRVTS